MHASMTTKPENAVSLREVEPAELETVAGGWCGSEGRLRFGPVPPTPPDPYLKVSQLAQVVQEAGMKGGGFGL